MNAREELEMAQRTKMALSLRLEGQTYREVAATIGVSVSTAHGYVKAALADIPASEADQLRTLECSRLDALQRAVWALAMEGDIEAGKQALRVIDRRVKLLGLDAPQQVQLSGADVDLDATVSKLLAVAQAAVEGTSPAPEGEWPGAPGDDG